MLGLLELRDEGLERVLVIAASCHQHGLAVGEARLGTVEATVALVQSKSTLSSTTGSRPRLVIRPGSVLVADRAVVVDPPDGTTR